MWGKPIIRVWVKLACKWSALTYVKHRFRWKNLICKQTPTWTKKWAQRLTSTFIIKTEKWILPSSIARCINCTFENAYQSYVFIDTFSFVKFIINLCGNKTPTRCNRWFLLQILLSGLRAVARRPDTQPSAPHHTDNLKTKHQIRQAAATCIILSSSWWWA